MLPVRRRSTRAARSSNVARGRAAERRARLYYLLRGYRLLGTNVRAGGNELDLILRRGSVLVFCEVKMRSSDAYGRAIEMVGAEKRRRLRRAAEAWLAAHPEVPDLDVSFEVLGIDGRRFERIRDAF